MPRTKDDPRSKKFFAPTFTLTNNQFRRAQAETEIQKTAKKRTEELAQKYNTPQPEVPKVETIRNPPVPVIEMGLKVDMAKKARPKTDPVEIIVKPPQKIQRALGYTIEETNGWIDNIRIKEEHKQVVANLASSGVYYGASSSFCFASEDFFPCHTFSSCKDYLGDLMFQVTNNTVPKEELGAVCSHTVNSPQFYPDKIRIIFRNNSLPEMEERMVFMRDLIVQAEVCLGIKSRTQFYRYFLPDSLNNKHKFFAVEGHSDWHSSGPMLSLYLQMIRVGPWHKPGRDWVDSLEWFGNSKTATGYSSDATILKSAMPGLRHLAKHGYEFCFTTDRKKNYPATARVISQTHSVVGIMAYGLGHNSLTTHWNRDWE